MKYKLIGLLLLLTISTVNSYNIKGKIAHFPNGKFELYSVYGEKETYIDTINTNAYSEFRYQFEENLKSGLYYLKFNMTDIIEFIFDMEDINLSTIHGSIKDSLSFHNSEMNKDFYLYKDEKQNFIRKFELLQPLIFEYPTDNVFFYKVQNEYLKVQKDFEQFCNEYLKKKPTGFLAKYIIVDRPVVVQPMDSYTNLLKYLKEHFFESALFNDPVILNSRVIPARIISYLALYISKNKAKDALEEDYKKAVDYILSQYIENNEIYNYILEYLQEGFQKYHFEKVLEYISLNYHYRNSCENEERRTLLQRRLDKISELEAGKKAPDIIEKDINGVNINLSSIVSEYTIVIFWASWCPHCKDILPKIKEMQNKIGKKKLQVLAISIDKDFNSLSKYLNDKNFGCININVPDGWNAKVCNDYNIYATPIMYLLDNEKKILGKPISVDAIIRMIK